LASERNRFDIARQRGRGASAVRVTALHDDRREEFAGESTRESANFRFAIPLRRLFATSRERIG